MPKCDDSGCQLHLFRVLGGRGLTAGEITRLTVWERTPSLNFTIREGKTYETSFRPDRNYKVELTFKSNGAKE